MTVAVVLCSHSRLWAVEANSVVVTICTVGVSLAGFVHSSVNKPGANGRVSYDSLTHSRLYCRDGRKGRPWISMGWYCDPTEM